MPKGFSLIFPSGKKLTSANVDLLQVAKDRAKTLWEQASLQESQRVRTVGPFWLQAMRPDSADGLVTCKQGKPVGGVVFFRPGKDPWTQYRQAALAFVPPATATLGPSGPAAVNSSGRYRGRRTPVTPPRPANDGLAGGGVDRGVPWGDVAIRLYAQYKGGERCGRVATWNPDGTRQFFGNYQYGMPQGCFCLFEADRPRLVVEYDDHSKLKAVHLIAAGKTEKTFESLKEAGADSEAGSLVAEITKEESSCATRTPSSVRSSRPNSTSSSAQFFRSQQEANAANNAARKAAEAVKAKANDIRRP